MLSQRRHDPVQASHDIVLLLPFLAVHWRVEFTSLRLDCTWLSLWRHFGVYILTWFGYLLKLFRNHLLLLELLLLIKDWVLQHNILGLPVNDLIHKLAWMNSSVVWCIQCSLGRLLVDHWRWIVVVRLFEVWFFLLEVLVWVVAGLNCVLKIHEGAVFVKMAWSQLHCFRLFFYVILKLATRILLLMQWATLAVRNLKDLTVIFNIFNHLRSLH